MTGLSSGGGCVDNNADMKTVTGFTCAQVVSHSLCTLKILPPLCTCSCAGKTAKAAVAVHQHPHRRRRRRRNQISYNATSAPPGQKHRFFK